MDVDIISIGDEVLYGYTLNSNASKLSKALLEVGLTPKRHIVVGDDEKAIRQAIGEAFKRSSLVIVTGGLGPTLDDKTKQVISECFCKRLVYNKKVAEWIRSHFGEVSTLVNQSMQIKGAEMLFNSQGTASGFIVTKGIFRKKRLIALPGVPQELSALLAEQLIPWMKEKYSVKKRCWIEPLHFLRLVEADIDPFLRALEEEYPSLVFGIYPSYSKVSVHIGAKKCKKKEFLRTTNEVKEKLLERFKDFYYDTPHGTLEELFHAFCLENRLTVSIGESCSGGALSSSLVQCPGASSYFLGGVVAYSNEAKKDLLGVKEKTLEKYGAVSIETTEEMTEGLLKKFSSDIALAISGILGPEGGSSEKPVGTVCMTIQFRDERPFSWQTHFQGTREVICEKAIKQFLSEGYFFLKKKLGSWQDA